MVWGIVMRIQKSGVSVALVGLALGGCVGMPADRGVANTHELIEARSGLAASVPLTPLSVDVAHDLSGKLLAAPVDIAAAVQLALINSPRMRLLYAELGFAQGEVYDATRLANPSLSYLRLSSDAVGGGAQTTWSIAQNFTELLFMGYRNGMGRADLLYSQQRVAQAVLQLESDVREAFYRNAGAQLGARMRTATAAAARTSADLAGRFHEAGNISLLQLNREQAAASEALLEERNGLTEAIAARSRLLTLLGFRADDDRARFVEMLALPAGRLPDIDTLQELAARQRLDLLASQTQAGILDRQLTHTQRWRWLGGLGLSAQREREPDGEIRKGPGLSIDLPLFNSGKGSLLRAQAGAETAAARLATLKLEMDNEIFVQRSTLEISRLAVEEYRTRLIPLQQRIVEASQREQNFMLIGAFELLAARREEIDTFGRYIEAVRDYWIEHSRLARSVGGALPGDETAEPLLLPQLPVTENSATGGGAQ